MIDITEPKITEKPACLEPSTLWACNGDDILPKKKWFSRRKKVDKSDLWIYLFYSKEEAECHASLPCDTWKWDGTPALPTSLHDHMFEARSEGLAGVQILGYRDSKWAILKQYPVNIPLI